MSVAGKHVAVDIGSTMIKVAHLGEGGAILRQTFVPRDLDVEIATQFMRVMADEGIDPLRDHVLACSSANGGLRVGIVCLTGRYSGTAIRNQVLLAGANPVFVHDLSGASGDVRKVDLLIVGGGIDCEDAGPAADLLAVFDAGKYNYGALVYCGNAQLAPAFRARFPQARVVDNPLADSLVSRVGSVFETVRRAYLDDLVLKEGVGKLPERVARVVRPTPEVAGRGFLRAVMNQSELKIVGACLVLDMGGATTDLHYSVELVADESIERPASGVSVARYVFTDLGVSASRDTLVAQLRNHSQLYEFLAVVLETGVRQVYADFRESSRELDQRTLSYGCVFLALDRFARALGPGLPKGDLERVAQLLLSGGAAQALDEAIVARLFRLLVSGNGPAPLVQIDRRYELWVSGITWTSGAPL